MPDDPEILPEVARLRDLIAEELTVIIVGFDRPIGFDDVGMVALSIADQLDYAGRFEWRR